MEYIVAAADRLSAGERIGACPEAEPSGKMCNFTEQMVHSDTLFSGIINCMGLLYGRKVVDEVIDKYIEEQPPFKISSAFLYRQEEYFVPRPYSLDLSSILDYKKAKKIKFLPLDFLMKFNEVESPPLQQELYVLPS